MSAVRAKMGRLLWIVLAASLAAACGQGVRESRVQFGVQGDVETLRPLLILTATAGDWTMVVNGDEIGTPESPNHSREYRTPEAGTLRIEAVLKRPGEATLATGTIELEIRDDWIWGVSIFLTDENPTRTCFGCIGYKAFAIPEGLTGEPQDSLFMVWGGNSISDPVVY